MILGAALSLALIGGQKIPSRSFDLFLLSSPGKPTLNTDWLSQTHNAGTEAALSLKLAKLDAAKLPFVVLQRAPDLTEERLPVAVLERNYETGPSMKQTTDEDQEVVQTSATTATSTMSLEVRPWAPKGQAYISCGYLYASTVPKERAFLILQDLNSYRTALFQGSAGDRKDLDRAMLVSADAVEPTMDALKSTQAPFDGICICAAGTPPRRSDQIAAFPSLDKVRHYRLSYDGKRWSVKFLEQFGPA